VAEEPGDVELYLALAARTGGPILELAAGSGRVAVPLAAAGYEVTAVDIDPAMLARAERAATAAGTTVRDRLDLVEADLVGLKPRGGPGYQLAILALNSILLLDSRPAQAAALETLGRHLAPGGLAVVDAWLPSAAELAGYDGRLSLEYVREDPETGRTVTKIASALHEPTAGHVTLTSIYDEARPGEPVIRWTRTDRMRLVNADDLRAMAESAGLEVELVAGDYDLDPIGQYDERVILLAQRRQRPSPSA
jgi:SAM-dependent methyltransferase